MTWYWTLLNSNKRGVSPTPNQSRDSHKLLSITLDTLINPILRDSLACGFDYTSLLLPISHLCEVYFTSTHLGCSPSPSFSTPACTGSFYVAIGSIPYDGVARKEILTVHPALTSIIMILACAGVLFTVACLIFNFIFRSRKWAKDLGSFYYRMTRVLEYTFLSQVDQAVQRQDKQLDWDWCYHSLHWYLLFCDSQH